MQISRRTKVNKQKTTTFIDFEGSYDENELIYCQKCYRVNVLSRLGPRLLRYDEVPAADYDRWLQCPRCGKLVSVNDVKHESEISEIIDLDDNSRRFESLGDKKDMNKNKGGIIRYKSRSKCKDPDKEIQQLIDSGVDITIHQ